MSAATLETYRSSIVSFLVHDAGHEPDAVDSAVGDHDDAVERGFSLGEDAENVAAWIEREASLGGPALSQAEIENALRQRRS